MQNLADLVQLHHCTIVPYAYGNRDTMTAECQSDRIKHMLKRNELQFVKQD